MLTNAGQPNAEAVDGVVLAVSNTPEYYASPIIPYLPELLVTIVAFLVFWWFIAKYISPRFEKIYSDRTNAIEGGMERAEQAQAEAEAAKKQYEEQLAGARSEAARIREDAKQQGAQIVAEMREQAQTEASRITETAHRQIEAERQQAMVSLRHDVGQISTDLASRIVGESLQDMTRQNDIVDRFLADLETGAVQPEQLGTTTEQAR